MEQMVLNAFIEENYKTMQGQKIFLLCMHKFNIINIL